MNAMIGFLVAIFVILLIRLIQKQKEIKSKDAILALQKKDWNEHDSFLEETTKKKKESWYIRKDREFRSLDINWDVKKHVILQFVCVSLAGLLGVLLLKAPVLILISAVAGGFLPNLIVKNKIKKNQEAFDHQYRNALIRLAALTRASASIQQGFWELANSRDNSERIRKEFYLAYADMNYNKSADEALTLMAERTNSDDVKMTALMVKIHRIKGGNLIELLEGIQESISLRTQQKRKMKTMSAQQMSQANLLIGLPFVTFLLFSIANPGYYGDFLQTFIGQFIFVGCVGMILTGRHLMNQIINSQE